MLTGTLVHGKRRCRHYRYRSTVSTIHAIAATICMTSARAFCMYDQHRDITAIILAGGASARMGTNKALLRWHERTFIEHTVECLQAQLDRIVINTNSPSEFTQFNLPLIADATVERCGPLAGILAALNYSPTALTLVVPCDNPLLSPQLVARMLATFESEQTDLAYACSTGDNYYLYALMRSDLHANLAAFLRMEDYAVRHWYATLRVSRVDFSDQLEHFRNINNAEELAQLPQR